MNALMSSSKHAAFTGDDATVSDIVGGHGMAYGEWAEFYNEELVDDHKIVQKWRAIDWPEDVWSMLTFEFEPDGEDTEMTFTQTDVPPDFVKDISKGWETEYWKKMDAYFKGE